MLRDAQRWSHACDDGEPASAEQSPLQRYLAAVTADHIHADWVRSFNHSFIRPAATQAGTLYLTQFKPGLSIRVHHNGNPVKDRDPRRCV